MGSTPSTNLSGTTVAPNSQVPPPTYSMIIEQPSCEHEDTKADSSHVASSALAISSLLAAGFDPHNMPNNTPYKAFRWACEEGSVSVVQWLLPKIKNIDSVIDTDFRAALSGLTGLHRASQGGHTDVVRLLLQQGADIEAVAGSGRMTPLMLAASNGKHEVVRELLAHGAETLPRTAYSESALYHAIKKGHEYCIRAILESPSEIDIWHTQGTRELDKACRLDNPVVIGLLLEKGAKFPMRQKNVAELYDTSLDYLHRASRDNNLTIVLVLLEMGLMLMGSLQVAQLYRLPPKQGMQIWSSY